MNNIEKTEKILLELFPDAIYLEKNKEAEKNWWPREYLVCSENLILFICPWEISFWRAYKINNIYYKQRCIVKLNITTRMRNKYVLNASDISFILISLTNFFNGFNLATLEKTIYSPILEKNRRSLFNLFPFAVDATKKLGSYLCISKDYGIAYYIDETNLKIYEYTERNGYNYWDRKIIELIYDQDHILNTDDLKLILIKLNNYFSNYE